MEKLVIASTVTNMYLCRVLILDRYSATLKLESQELVEAVGGQRQDQS